jgi:anti-sigma factor RsiW
LTPDERAELVAYLDGELPEAVSRVIATKLTHSATARREVESLRKTWELLGHLTLPQVSEQFTDRTISQIRLLEQRASRWEPTVKSWSARVAYTGVYLILAGVCLGLGYAGCRWIWPDPSAQLARDLSLAEHLDEYLDVGSFEFLSHLANSAEFSIDAP